MAVMTNGRLWTGRVSQWAVLSETRGVAQGEAQVLLFRPLLPRHLGCKLRALSVWVRLEPWRHQMAPALGSKSHPALRASNAFALVGPWPVRSHFITRPTCPGGTRGFLPELSHAPSRQRFLPPTTRLPHLVCAERGDSPPLSAG